MGLRQTISEWIRIAKDALDFGPDFPAAMAAHRLEFAEELAKLQHLLEQAQKVSREKDELIAKLQAAGAIRGNMIVDGSAYFVKKENVLDGPFCMSCFQRNHETTRIVPAPKPKGADGPATAWVQCAKCRTLFRSDRIGEYLNPRKAASAETSASPEGSEEAKFVKAARKPHAQNRRLKGPRSEQTRATARPRQAR
jgi:hypothetical protein